MSDDFRKKVEEDVIKLIYEEHRRGNIYIVSVKPNSYKKEELTATSIILNHGVDFFIKNMRIDYGYEIHKFTHKDLACEYLHQNFNNINNTRFRIINGQRNISHTDLTDTKWCIKAYRIEENGEFLYAVDWKVAPRLLAYSSSVLYENSGKFRRRVEQVVNHIKRFYNPETDRFELLTKTHGCTGIIKPLYVGDIRNFDFTSFLVSKILKGEYK